MPFPKVIARLNRRTVNPAMLRFAGNVRPFAIVTHRGRQSGAEHRTPVFAFPTANGFVIALTYGCDVDWVKNVSAAGECQLLYRRRSIPAHSPTFIDRGEGMAHMPGLIRLILRLFESMTSWQCGCPRIISPGHAT